MDTLNEPNEENNNAESTNSRGKILEVLQRCFGLVDFKPLQYEVISSALSEENPDIFLVLATGGGKSLCFQVPAIISNGATIVVGQAIF